MITAVITLKQIRMRTARIIIAMAVLACVAYPAYLLMQPNPSAMLVERHVPVPSGVRASNFEYGGIFAKYLFVRFQLTEDQMDGYRELLPDGLTLNSPSGAKVVSRELSTEETLKLIEQDTKPLFRAGPKIEWWNIDEIKMGTYHFMELENPCGYEVFLDSDESIAYVYWHYS